MIAERTRMTLCIALALLAHAALLAGLSAAHGEPRTASPLRATRRAAAEAQPEQAALRAAHAQRGADRYTRKQRAESRTRRNAASAASGPATSGRHSPTRFVMVADRRRARRRDPNDRQPAEPAHDAARTPRQKRAAAARADTRAAYLTAWQDEIEARGSRAYPSGLLAGNQARRLTMAVRIAADGSLSGVRLMHSSGNRALDRAALAVVRDAAPFTPFDPKLGDASGNLGFAYDWLFEAGDARLSAPR